MGTTSSRSIVGGLLALLAAATFGPGFAQDGERAADRSWPREIQTSNARITVYEPQLEVLTGNHLTLRAAISAMPEGASSPVFGALWLEADLQTDAGRRTATPLRVGVTDIRFPNLNAVEAAEWRGSLASEVLGWKLEFSVDRLLSDLKILEERRAAAQALKAEVPRILFFENPAVLLSIEGDPAWRSLPGTSFRRIANSSFFVIRDAESGTCFLRISPYWWISRDPLGPWAPIDDAPAEVVELWKNEPQPQVPTSDPGQDAPPRPHVVPSTQPAELIWSDGPPEYAPLNGTGLLYVRNTESDVFLEISTQATYVLLSGRWYRSSDKETWEFVPADQLPADFSRIPLSSEKQHVLACVAGTLQARQAVADAAVPRTQAVKPGPAPEVSVSYDGQPEFTQVPDSPVSYAVNSPDAVFRVGGSYYSCDDGIWYEGSGAWGPWSVCSWVPPAIYLLPPSCPYYYVTYCRVFCSGPSEIVCGYYPGYLGCYAWGGTVVYGTGWHYRCWSGQVWCPRPVTWGVGVRFHAPSCSWTVRVGGEGTCAWTGVRRVSTYRAPSVAAGAGGWWSGVGYRRGDAGPRRNVDCAPPPTPHRPSDLYARRPDRVIPARPLPPPRGTPPSTVPPARTPPGYGRHPSPPGHPDAPSAPPGRGESSRPPGPPPSAGHDGPERPKSPPSPVPREIPRPSPAPPAPRETPKPPSRDPRETPPSPPPPAPPREYHEAPRTPPPPPPPRERRETPPSPPPAPPPREHRDAPRNPPPPPPPPPREHREAPKSPPPPPPPPREHRDPPRQPPREQDSSKDRGRR